MRSPVAALQTSMTLPSPMEAMRVSSGDQTIVEDVLIISGVPYPYYAVICGVDEVQPISRPGDITQIIRLLLIARETVTVGCVPDLESAIPPSRGNRGAIRRPGESIYSRGMSSIDTERLREGMGPQKSSSHYGDS